MSNIRCGNCGFLNFAQASSCKRCKATFEETPPPQISQQFTELQPAFEGGYQMTPEWPQPALQPYYFPMPIAPLPATSKNGATNAGLWVLLTLSVALAFGIGILWKFGKPAPTISGWQEYRAPDNSFTVQMPAKPQETVQSQPTPIGEVQMHIAASLMQEKGMYVAAYGDYPIAPTNVSTSALLDAAANGAVAHSGATMISKKSITLNGYQGIEIEMTVPASKAPGGGRAVSRIYWASPRIYILLVAGQDSSGIYESKDKFLDSFRITK